MHIRELKIVILKRQDAWSESYYGCTSLLPRENFHLGQQQGNLRDMSWGAKAKGPENPKRLEFVRQSIKSELHR